MLLSTKRFFLIYILWPDLISFVLLCVCVYVVSKEEKERGIISLFSYIHYTQFGASYDDAGDR